MVFPASETPISGSGTVVERDGLRNVDLCGREVVFRTGFFPPPPLLPMRAKQPLRKDSRALRTAGLKAVCDVSSFKWAA